jgi:hypothetical protein
VVHFLAVVDVVVDLFAQLGGQTKESGLLVVLRTAKTRSVKCLFERPGVLTVSDAFSIDVSDILDNLFHAAAKEFQQLLHVL